MTGSGRGALNTINGDVVSSSTGTISLTGVPDTEAPIVGLYTIGLLGDQFTPFELASSEPLPVEARPVLRSTAGDVFALKGSPGDMFNIEFTPAAMLPYQQSYAFEIDNVVDFAGNQPMLDGVLTFGTVAPPPLVAADGFESQSDMLVPATALFVSGPDFPIISGTRSLYVPPEIPPGPLP